jgi:C-terminal processing protease CtpA/Prc
MRALLRFLWKSTVWLVKAALVLVLVVGALIVLSGLDKQQQNTPGLARIGVDVVDLTPEGAAQVGVNPKLQGVLVNRVIENGPAFRADLLPGDVIVRVNGKPVGSAKELVSRVRKQRVGWSVPVQYFRRGEPQTAMITPTGF